MKFSVIIPTYNRSNMLAGAIASVRAQSFNEDEYEIIVVDNGSKDDTCATVDRLNQTGGKQVLYVYEAEPGLHFARHAGARIASGDILVYIDDDVLVSTNWLYEYSKAYATLNPDSAGGKILIRWDREPPSWIIPFEPVLGRLDFGKETRLLQPGQYINGGNFSIKKDRLFQIGGFNPDQIGDILIGDGETGLCKKIYQAGWRVAWCPGALIWHCQFVDKNGTLSDLKRRFSNNGVCFAYQQYREGKQNKYKLIYLAIKSTKRVFFSKIRAIKYYLYKSDAYFSHELSASYYWSIVKFLIRLSYDCEIQKMVLHNNWINE
jgi:glycosyltransferase involved in cell wall biosynthesis